MNAAKMAHIPKLRFPEFVEPWKTDRVDSFVKRVSNPVAVELDSMYRQIGVRSHGKGIFHKEPVTGKSLGEKRVFWVHPKAFVVNIVFGWEQAVALTSDMEEGYVASHRFPMFVPVEKKTDLNFLLLFFLRKRGKYLLGLASPGGAGRNKTLGQNEFAKLDVTFPPLLEQQEIAAFVGAVDKKLEVLRRKHELLRIYKRGMMQKIFSQELRFKAEDGTEFPDCLEKRLGEIAIVQMGQSPDSSSYNDSGVGVPLIQGNADLANGLTKPRRFTSKPTKLCEEGSILLSVRAPVGELALSIHRACLGRGVCSIRARKHYSNTFLYQWLLWFEKQWIRIGQGSTFTAISGDDIRKLKILMPVFDEQQKIAAFLSAIDAKIDAVAEQIYKMKQFKKGLLQQMFV
jgi:type I restriction enzyme S subunit